MKECNQCHIKIQTHQTYCPLCHQTLTGETDPNFVEEYPYKELDTDHLPKKTIDILLYIGIFCIVVLGIINLSTMATGFWSLIPIGSIIYTFILIRFSILSRVNSMKRVTFTSLFAFLLLLFINYFTNKESLWSIDFVLPSLIMANNFIILLIMLIRNKPFKEYVINLLILVFLSFVPLIHYYTGLTDVVIMPILTLSQGGLILTFMIVFYPKILKDVLQRTFHI